MCVVIIFISKVPKKLKAQVSREMGAEYVGLDSGHISPLDNNYEGNDDSFVFLHFIITFPPSTFSSSRCDFAHGGVTLALVVEGMTDGKKTHQQKVTCCFLSLLPFGNVASLNLRQVNWFLYFDTGICAEKYVNFCINTSKARGI